MMKGCKTRRLGFAATVRACALLLLGVSVPAYAESVSFTGVQTQLPLTVAGESLNFPYGVAVSAKGVFIADSDNNRVVEIPAGCTMSSCQITLSVSVNGLKLNHPQGVAVDGAGDVFIADTYNNRVVGIQAGTGTEVTVGSGLKNPESVAADKDGDVWIADTNNSRVVAISAAGVQTTAGTGLSYPAGVAVDADGDVFIADTDNNRVVEIAANGTQTTVAGCTTSSCQSTVLTSLGYPTGVAVDVTGNVFIANSSGSTSSWLLKVPPGGGAPTAVGSGLSFPFQLAVDVKGDVFIADSSNNRVVEVQPGPVNFGNINVCPAGQTTPAPCSATLMLDYSVNADVTFGSAPVSVVTQGVPNLDFTMSSAFTTCPNSLNAVSACFVDASFAPLVPGLRMGAVQFMDNSGNVQGTSLIQGVGQGPAIAFNPGTQATLGSGLSSPFGLAVDGNGDVFIADSNNARVVEVPAGGGTQTTVGSGLTYPTGVAVDGAGDVFITDRNANQVVEVPAGGGTQTTVGSGLAYPSGVAVDGAGDVFIADTNNSRVVEVPVAGGTPTVVSPGLILGHALTYPEGVAVDGSGDVFIADTDSNRVVELQFSQAPTLTFATTAVGGTSTDSPQSVMIQNIGDQPLTGTLGLSLSPNFTQSVSLDCTTSFPLVPGATCDESFSFTPQATGSLAGTAVFTDNALNNSDVQQTINLSGTGQVTVPGAPTSVTATAGPNNVAGDGQVSVSWTAPSSNGAAITGYTVTASPGGTTVTVAGTSVTVSGLVPGTAYTFTVTATNSVGTGAAGISNSVTPVTVPGAPTGPTATAGDGQATVSFTAPASNGAPITGYTVTSSPGGITGSGTNTSVGVSGLADGTAYTFTVTATNSLGTGPASIPSNSVTPVSVTVGAPISETITANDVVTITPLINVNAPFASFSTNSLDFGNVAAGTTGTQIITVSNVGEGPTGLMLSSPVISQAGTAFMSGPIACSNGATSFSTTLSSGGACLVAISYTAPASGAPSPATITFTDNAALSNLPSVPAGVSNYTQTITLNGTGTTAPQPIEPPLISSVTPNVGLPGQQGLQVTISGADFVAGATAVTFGGGTAGITVASLTVNSTNTATAVLNIDPSTAPGSYDVVVTVNGALSPATLTGGFTVAALINEAITVNDQVSITVSQSITFGPAPTVVVFGSGQLNATASSGLPVTFSSTTPAICSVTGNTVTDIAVGSCIVAANQAGNAIYSPAPQVTQTISIIGLFPLTLTFGDQLVGSTSATQTVTLVNTSALALTVGAITTTGDFTHPSKTCATYLRSGYSCTISVAFAPKSTGTLTGTLKVGTNGTVALSGTGIVPSASITPATYTFANQQVGTTSTVQTFTYTNTTYSNTAPVSITVSSLALTGEAPRNYAIASDGCSGVTLAPAATCDVGVTFTPSVANNRTATLTVKDETGGAANVTTSLSGTGVAPTASLTGNAAFGNQQVGVTSAAQTLTYQNTGIGPISVSSVTLSGAAAANYIVATDACTGATLAASATCSIGVTLTPTAVGSQAAKLTVTDITGGAPVRSLSLSGTGVAPTISLGSGTYAYRAVKVATAKTFTLTNSGTAPLVITTITLTTVTQFEVTGGTCAVGGIVSNDSSCTMIVVFTPSGTTGFSDTLTVSGTGIGAGAPTYTTSRNMTGS